MAQPIPRNFNELQTALNNAAPGDTIQLQGAYDFGAQSVKVQKGVTIVGLELEGNLPTITGGGNNAGQFGNAVFEVAAPGQFVSIQNLQFISPNFCAIRASAVNGLSITGCRIEEVIPMLVGGFNTGVGILVGIPDPTHPTRANSGDLVVSGNYISTLGSATQGTLGILFNYAGIDLSLPARLIVTRNTVEKVTAFGIDCRELMGEAEISGNVISMGSTGSRLR
jgi:hypothetical protein